MNPKTEELLNRTFMFGVNTLKFLNGLPQSVVNKVIMYQLAKSSTSVGANYEESQAAESKNDFIHKIGIVAKETRESKFWLKILNELIKDENQKEQITVLIEECEQLCKIFISIKLTTQKHNKKN